MLGMALSVVGTQYMCSWVRLRVPWMLPEASPRPAWCWGEGKRGTKMSKTLALI